MQVVDFVVMVTAEVLKNRQRSITVLFMLMTEQFTDIAIITQLLLHSYYYTVIITQLLQLLLEVICWGMLDLLLDRNLVFYSNYLNLSRHVAC